MEFLKPYVQIHDVYQVSPAQNNFEEAYLAVRGDEGRIYSDSIVRDRPRIPAQHPHYQEWRLRWKSTQRLMGYMRKTESRLILDLGCGNGWFTRHLAAYTKGEVLGVDINHIFFSFYVTIHNKNYHNSLPYLMPVLTLILLFQC